MDKLRNILEKTLEPRANGTIFVGKGNLRLPNTSLMVTPGWKGETQVMQMDLAGFRRFGGLGLFLGQGEGKRRLARDGPWRGRGILGAAGVAGAGDDRGRVMAFAEAWLAARDRWAARGR